MNVKRTPPNPSGLCMCGCGEPTPLAKKTDHRYGVRKGEARRFVFGHAALVTSDSTRAKMSEAGRGKVKSPEHLRNISLALRRRRTEEPALKRFDAVSAVCSRCDERKPLAAFSAVKNPEPGLRPVQSWCKPCVAADNRIRFGGDPRKSYARLAVLRALRSGRLTKGPCEVCGTTDDVERHHDDYAHPLRVRWLCVTHHLIEHRR